MKSTCDSWAKARQALTCFVHLVGHATFRTKDLLTDLQRILNQPEYRLSQLRYDLGKLDCLYVGRGSFAEALATPESIPAARLPEQAVPLRAASLLGLGRTAEAEALTARAAGSPKLAMALAEVFLAARQPDGALKALSAAPSTRTPGWALRHSRPVIPVTGRTSAAVAAVGGSAGGLR